MKYITRLQNTFQLPPSTSSLQYCAVMAEELKNGTSINDDINPFSELIPVICQCFTIMLGGYIAGRTRIISAVEAKGLNMFVSYAALPSLIFLSLATLDFSNVNWIFLIAIFIAKSSIFVVVAFVTSIVNWPKNFGKAGIYGIFVTQSNDFALGYPIVIALYSKTHPEYASYLYLVAPISLCILNPLGFILLEIDKERRTMFPSQTSSIDQESTSKQIKVSRQNGVFWRVIMGVLRNPVVIMTFLGIISNLIFGNHLPDILYSILKVTGSAFSATALFLLGLNMVGKISTFKNGNNLLLPILLIVIKIIALPLIIKEVISLLRFTGLFDAATSMENITEFGFLYGTFPSAPTVFVFASAYDIALDVIASAMVACTMLSAPLMFISAKMISLDVTDPQSYYLELDRVSFYLGLVSLVLCLWVMLIMYTSKKYKRIPHIFTVCLMFGEIVAIFGVFVGQFVNADIPNYALMIYTSFLSMTIGIFSSQFMAMFVAISTAMLHIKDISFVLKMRKYAILFGFGVPTAVFSIFCAVESLEFRPAGSHNQLEFLVSNNLAAISLGLNLLCLLITLIATVFDQYHQHRKELYRKLLVEDVEDLIPEKEKKELIRNSIKDKKLLRMLEDNDTIETKVERSRSYGNRRDEILCENFGICKRKSYKSQDLITGYETKKRSSKELMGFQFSLRGFGLPIGTDTRSNNLMTVDEEIDQESFEIRRKSVLSISKHGKGVGKSSNPSGELNKDQNHQTISMPIVIRSQSSDDLLESSANEHELQPHLVLVVYTCVTMLSNISAATCILLLEKPNGIYIELEFLNAILTFSLGIIVFFMFGIDLKLILVPFQNLIKFFKEQEKFDLPPLDCVSEETLHICEQFSTYHIDKCMSDIVRDIKWRLRLYKSAFWGKDLISWLIKTGLAHDRSSAVKYGKALLEGRLIKQIEDKHHFHDSFYLYMFNLGTRFSDFDMHSGSINSGFIDDEDNQSSEYSNYDLDYRRFSNIQNETYF